jgi:hypothetical protein
MSCSGAALEVGHALRGPGIEPGSQERGLRRFIPVLFRAKSTFRLHVRPTGSDSYVAQIELRYLAEIRRAFVIFYALLLIASVKRISSQGFTTQDLSLVGLLLFVWVFALVQQIQGAAHALCWFERSLERLDLGEVTQRPTGRLFLRFYEADRRLLRKYEVR